MKAHKDWKKNPKKYNGEPRPPKYMKKDAYREVVYTNQACVIRDGYIQLTRKNKLFIPQWTEYSKKILDFDEIKFMPDSSLEQIKCSITYEEVNTESNGWLDYNLHASGDIGVNNVLTLVTDLFQPLLFSGYEIKSNNKFANKNISISQEIAKTVNDVNMSARINELY